MRQGSHKNSTLVRYETRISQKQHIGKIWDNDLTETAHW